MSDIRVAIIGAGPAGLVTLKTLLEASSAERKIEACVFEGEPSFGGTFKYRSYANSELVSSKQLTAFSDHRFPRGTPDHVSLPEYVDYLSDYIHKYDLAKHINYGCRVTSIDRRSQSESSGSAHRVRFNRENIPDYMDCTHVAICTGLHVKPNMPAIPGIDTIAGAVLHSSSYKSRDQLVGRDVLILGCGETAMDIAYESIKADAKSVTMCFRTGFLSFPKVLNRFQVFGKRFGGSLPIDGLITNLFETSYVHWAVGQSRLRWFISDFVIKRVMWFLTGTQAGCNQHVGALPKERLGRAYVFLNKSHKAMPYLNRPYKRPDPVLEFMGNQYLDPPEDAQSTKWIDTCTFPTYVDKQGQVHFEQKVDRKDWQRMQGKVVKPDCVVFCTGYIQDFAWLSSSYPTADQTNVRNIVHSDQPDVAFIGFVRPGVGAIPPIAEQQAMWWTALILGKMALPTTLPHYHLLATKSSRIQYGVDHSAYMATLAKDFGGAPDLWELYQEHGWRILLIYSFGASFVTFYRLLGPFKSPVAPQIARTELAETIMRRGLIGNFFFGVLPMMFYGLLNLLAYTLELTHVIGPEPKQAV